MQRLNTTNRPFWISKTICIYESLFASLNLFAIVCISPRFKSKVLETSSVSVSAARSLGANAPLHSTGKTGHTLWCPGMAIFAVWSLAWHTSLQTMIKTGGFHKWGYPQNGSKWLVYKGKSMEILLRWMIKDDLGVALFQETPILAWYTYLDHSMLELEEKWKAQCRWKALGIGKSLWGWDGNWRGVHHSWGNWT